MNDLFEIFKHISLLLFIFFSKYRFNPNVISSILLGVGTGVVANSMFVFTTEKEFNGLRLFLSFSFGIILLVVGSLEKKEE